MLTDYQKYVRHSRKIADVACSMAVLQWDMETYMPQNGSGQRAEQLSTLAGILHELSTDDTFGELIEKLRGNKELNGVASRNIERSYKEFKKRLKYPSDFVTALSKKTSEAYHAWVTARQQADFGLFSPALSSLLQMKTEECELLGYEQHPYDALLDDFEEGMHVAMLDKLFGEIRRDLLPFVSEILEKEPPDDAFLYQHQFDKARQWEFSIRLLKQMGFDFDSGRQDYSIHPFTTNFSSRDVRITTRGNERDLREMLWCSIHEGGHALYEQGLPADDYGLPSGESLSLSIHESQSRLWENNVGRSACFWKYQFPALKALFPVPLSNVGAEQFYRAINKVQAGCIRVAADELTYHFHIMVRYETEKALLEKQLPVSDLPAYWNEKYKEYLSVDVPSDDAGVLQDIHWAHGSFGYFPTYSLGSFYAAQFYTAASQQINHLEESIAKGRLSPLTHWLREKIHRYGKTYTADELCSMVTGEKLHQKYFLRYVRNKYSEIYHI